MRIRYICFAVFLFGAAYITEDMVSSSFAWWGDVPSLSDRVCCENYGYEPGYGGYVPPSRYGNFGYFEERPAYPHRHTKKKHHYPKKELPAIKKHHVVPKKHVAPPPKKEEIPLPPAPPKKRHRLQEWLKEHWPHFPKPEAQPVPPPPAPEVPVPSPNNGPGRSPEELLTPKKPGELVQPTPPPPVVEEKMAPEEEPAERAPRSTVTDIPLITESHFRWIMPEDATQVTVKVEESNGRLIQEYKISDFIQIKPGQKLEVIAE